jgi:hemerythrin-like domain-containing protein
MGKKMNCTDELCLDHEEIIAFLTILDLSIKKLESGKVACSEDLRWLFEFNRDFVIRNHNQKEENILFPALVSAGIPDEQIDSIIGEHELIRSRAKTVRGFIEDYDEGAFGARARLADAGRRYIDLLKWHIEFEEKAVYSIAEELLSNELDEHLATKLRVFVETRVGVGRLIDLQEILDSLKEIYGIEL